MKILLVSQGWFVSLLDNDKNILVFSAEKSVSSNEVKRHVTNQVNNFLSIF
jgi:hypothetical protein